MWFLSHSDFFSNNVASVIFRLGKFISLSNNGDFWFSVCKKCSFDWRRYGSEILPGVVTVLFRFRSGWEILRIRALNEFSLSDSLVVVILGRVPSLREEPFPLELGSSKPRFCSRYRNSLFSTSKSSIDFKVHLICVLVAALCKSCASETQLRGVQTNRHVLLPDFVISYLRICL